MSHRGRTAICREGWYLVFLLVAVGTWAILREANLLLIAVGMLLGPLVLNWRLAVATLRGIEVRRRIGTGGYAGGWLTVEVELRNTRRRLGSWMLVVRDWIQREVPSTGSDRLRPRVLFSHVSAGDTQRQVYRISLDQRGRYGVGPIVVSTRFPFGLFRRTVEIDHRQDTVVYPRLGSLSPAWRQGYQEAPQGQRGIQRPTRAVGDFFAVRQWQSGDSIRCVHWRGTARHGQLMVRQFEQPGEHNTALLLDLWQPAKPTEEQLENVELAVSFTATIIADTCRVQRSRLLLAIGGPNPVCVSGIAASSLMRDALEKLAVAEASPEDWRSELFEAAGRHIGPAEEIVLVSTRDARWKATPPDAAVEALPGDATAGARVREVHPGEHEFYEYFSLP
jgi:uncharacterized protein (DUF58 family)